MAIGCDSRSDKSPRQWSRSPFVNRIPWIGLCRGPRGCRGVKPSICWRISGEAFRRNHAAPSAETATDSCVRGLALMLPSRAPRQLGHPQFHCGKPPPAAEPKTRTRKSGLHETRQPCFGLSGPKQGLLSEFRVQRRLDAVAVVFLIPADLGVQADFDELGLR